MLYEVITLPCLRRQKEGYEQSRHPHFGRLHAGEYIHFDLGHWGWLLLQATNAPHLDVLQPQQIVEE